MLEGTWVSKSFVDQSTTLLLESLPLHIYVKDKLLFCLAIVCLGSLLLRAKLNSNGYSTLSPVSSSPTHKKKKKKLRPDLEKKNV